MTSEPSAAAMEPGGESVEAQDATSQSRYATLRSAICSSRRENHLRMLAFLAHSEAASRPTHPTACGACRLRQCTASRSRGRLKLAPPSSQQVPVKQRATGGASAVSLREARSGADGVVWTAEGFSSDRHAQAEHTESARTSRVPRTWKRIYQEKASRYWDIFYKRNETRFFKDRHYLTNDFVDLQQAKEKPMSFLEIGCGVGNAMLPLVDKLPHLRAYGLDLSKRAIQFLRSNPSFQPDRCGAYVCDATREPLPADVREREPHGVDVALCLFMLSAMPPEAHLAAIKFAFSALKPGGVLLVRDYGRFDAAQLRFSADNKLDDHFYVRHDGTCAYFFTTEELGLHAATAGFLTREDQGCYCRFIRRAYNIRRNTEQLHRVWIEARFQRPEAD